MIAVVPLAGTWIETPEAGSDRRKRIVVPLAGTWIETAHPSDQTSRFASFPLRERGLKLKCPGLCRF